jgi:hypothetical protein
MNSEVGPAVVPEKRNFRLRQGYAETRWRGKMRPSTSSDESKWEEKEDEKLRR